jgi:hypothetical protein
MVEIAKYFTFQENSKIGIRNQIKMMNYSLDYSNYWKVMFPD